MDIFRKLMLIILNASLLWCLILWPFPSISMAGVHQWQRDVAMTTSPGDQGMFQLAIVPDGSNGAIIIWQDRLRSLVFARRLDAEGNKLWPARPVGLSLFEKFYPAAIQDGAGGVITAWVEGRNGSCGSTFMAECDIYVQRLDSNGQRIWSANGRPVVRAERNQGVSGVAMASDNKGGVFLAWEDARLPECCKVYAQHLGADGKPLWPEDGIRVSPEPFIIFGPMDGPPQIVSDGKGGVLIAWINNQVNPHTDPVTLNVQRLNAQGDILWPEGGITVGEPIFRNFSLAADGLGGALLAFTMKGLTGLADVAVQKIGPGGSLDWGKHGTRAATASYYHEAPQIIPDERGGAFVVWVDHLIDIGTTEETNIRAQRIASDGTPLWQSRGRMICDLPGTQDNVRMISDGKGGSILAWKDCRDYIDRDACFESANLYGQHILANGRLAWPTQGAPISKARGTQGVPQGIPLRESSIVMATDQDGGAILAWPDGRNGFCSNAMFTTECDVYAQRILDEATPLSADLALNLSVVQKQPSGEIVFTFHAENLGAAVAYGVKVLAPFPANTEPLRISSNGVLYGYTLLFKINKLEPKETMVAWFAVRPLAQTNICTRGTVYSEVLDGQPANNKSKACVTSQ